MAEPSRAASPLRGEIWDVELDPVIGREQAGVRPALVISSDGLNRSPRDLVVVLPITGTDRGFPTQVAVNPPDGGLTKPSQVMTEQIRSVSRRRFLSRRGVVSAETLALVEDTLRIVLGL